MRRSLPYLLAAVLLLPGAAAPAEPADSPFTLDVRLAALGGAASGLGTRRDSGGVGLLRADLVPALRRGALELRVPLRLDRDQTVGWDLTETRASGALAPEWRFDNGVRIGAEAGVLRVWRLDWPDQYQPSPTGGLLPTDRYSYVALHGGASAYSHAARHHHLRARWRVTSYDYTRDPAFEVLAADPTPTHLTPRDNVTNELDLSWRYLQPAWALATRLDTAFRHDFVYPARRARTGTPVAFQKQRLNDYEPRVELELRRLARGVKLSLELGWAIREDTFEGYYSYSGPHPHVAVEWAATERLGLSASAQAWWLRYGPDSKANTEDGKRLFDHRGEVKGHLRYAVGGGVSLLGEAAWRGRTTNYPDYVPGVFPATRLYDIRWDYDNTRVLAGAEWRR